jgi:hypothetical protein
VQGSDQAGGRLVRSLHQARRMAVAPRDEHLAHDAVASSVRVVESAVELARAEAKLLVLRARHMAVEAIAMGLGVVVAITFIEVTLILAAISPLYLAGHSLPATPWPLLASIGIALTLAAGGGLVAWLAWRRFRAGGEA